MTDELNPYPGNLKQHTVLNAEELASKRYPDNYRTGDAAASLQVGLTSGYFNAICEVAQPLADELATVKAERDDILNELKEQARLLGEGGSREAALVAENNELRKALEGTHEAIDRLMAMLISSKAGFLPTQCGQPWEAAKIAHHILTKYPKQDEPNETK